MEEKTYYQIKKEFFERYKKVILPVLQSYEEERLQQEQLIFKIRLICIFVVVFFAFCCLFLLVIPFFHFILFFAIAVFFGCDDIIKKNFEKKIKEKIMPAICRCFGDLKWSCGVYENISIFSESNLIPYYTSSSFDDIFKGSWRDVELEIIESSFSRRSGKNSYTVFEGIIIKLEMNKEFSSNTVIKADTLRHQSPDNKLKHTELEDVVFEKKYDVFTNDPIDARYLITTAFMERINNLAKVFNLKISSIAFFKNNLLIAFETDKDMFALCDLDKSLPEFSDLAVLFDEIMSVYKLIDYFKLDKKTGI